MFVRAGIEDIEQNIDRAHRIGKSYHNTKSKKKCKDIIVKFTSFRYRTKAYRKKWLTFNWLFVIIKSYVKVNFK